VAFKTEENKYMKKYIMEGKNEQVSIEAIKRPFKLLGNDRNILNKRFS
jgi:hypothetical protein